jgi:hypothetical protein
MNSKLFPTLATVAIAVASAVAMTSAFAVEATQYNPEAGSKSRAEVKADVSAKSNGVVQYGEATVFVDKASTQSRAVARSDAADAPVRVVRLGDATEFVDQPGVRSRAEVRSETLAAIRAGRHQ